MLMMPRRVTRRKQFRGRMKGKATRGNKLAYGSYGLVATEPCWLTANQLEAARVAINRFTKRGGNVWINVFPQKPVSKNLSVLVWVKVRALQSSGLPLLNQAECYLN